MFDAAFLMDFCRMNGGSIFDRFSGQLFSIKHNLYVTFFALLPPFRLSRGFPTIYLESIYLFLSKLLNFMPRGSILNRVSPFLKILHRFSIFFWRTDGRYIFVGFSLMCCDFQRISIRCAKLLENPENQGLTLFVFLLPYFGVSGSLMYLNRQILTRPIDWHQKFLILCHVGRYSTVFVLFLQIFVGFSRMFNWCMIFLHIVQLRLWHLALQQC